MGSEIDSVIRRTRRYWYEDGFAELASGGLLLLGGLGLYMTYHGLLSGFSGDLAWRCIVALLVIGAAEGAAIIGLRSLRGGIESAKSRFTYPRTGYVAYRQPQPRKRSLPQQIGAFILVFVVSMLGGAGLAALGSSGTIPAWLMSMPMSLGAVIAIGLVVLARQMGLARFYGLAAASLLAALVAAMGDISFVGGMLYLVFMGTILLISGGLTLWRYIRRHAPPVTGVEDADHDG